MLLLHMLANVTAIGATIITQNACIFSLTCVSADVCLFKIRKIIE